MKKAIVLLSGGIDSSTTLAIANSEGCELYCLTFDYGQVNKYELKTAKAIADLFKVEDHKIIHIDLSELGGSALTGDGKVPQGEKEEKDIPITYVPARNTIFLSYALAWGEVLKITDIYFGSNTVDFSGYPDCRKEYIESFEKTANLGTRQGSQGKKIKIHTPIINMPKADIIKKGEELEVDFSKTCSCYNPSEKGIACGICESCRIRKAGFKKAGIKDPIKYKQ